MTDASHIDFVVFHQRLLTQFTVFIKPEGLDRHKTNAFLYLENKDHRSPDCNWSALLIHKQDLSHEFHLNPQMFSLFSFCNYRDYFYIILRAKALLDPPRIHLKSSLLDRVLTLFLHNREIMKWLTLQ